MRIGKLLGMGIATLPLGIIAGSPANAQIPDHPSIDPTMFAQIEGIVGGGRYMEVAPCRSSQSPEHDRCCARIPSTDSRLTSTLAPYRAFLAPGPGHQGLQDCRYSSSGIETRVVMLNPTPSRVAEWTISACTKANASSLVACARWLWKNLYSASGTQFAVDGVVVEDNKGCGIPDKFVGYTFRDGVTVRLATLTHVCDGDLQRLRAEPSAYFGAKVLSSAVPGPGRVAMLNREQYARYFKTAVPDDRPKNGEIAWLATVRTAHLTALSSTSHAWVDEYTKAELPKSLRNE